MDLGVDLDQSLAPASYWFSGLVRSVDLGVGAARAAVQHLALLVAERERLADQLLLVGVDDRAVGVARS